MLEPQNKINVEFQPSKKMKKRRELDALVCNGKVRRKSKSGHELLRTESESSEIDELFYINFILWFQHFLIRVHQVLCC
jgi:hypothetical protein